MIPLKLTEDLRLMMRLRVFGSGVKQTSCGGNDGNFCEYWPLRGLDFDLHHLETGPSYQVVMVCGFFSDFVCAITSLSPFSHTVSLFSCRADH